MAHQLAHERTIATRACTRAPSKLPSPASSLPNPATSAQTGEAVPECESMAEWNFSAPIRDARHWKNSTPDGAPGDGLIAHGPHLAGRLGNVALSPVDTRTGLLHHHPGHVLVERADKVVVHGAQHGPFGVGRVDVIVSRDDIELRGPSEVVKRLEKAHEIGRYGDVRARPFQDGALSRRNSSKKASLLKCR